MAGNGKARRPPKSAMFWANVTPFAPEHDFRTLFETHPTPMWVYDPDRGLILRHDRADLIDVANERKAS